MTEHAVPSVRSPLLPRVGARLSGLWDGFLGWMLDSSWGFVTGLVLFMALLGGLIFGTGTAIHALAYPTDDKPARAEFPTIEIPVRRLP